MKNNLSLSIVTTIYQSENTIKSFINKIAECANKNFGDNYEIIIVNDGSTDQSLNIAIEESKLSNKI